MAMEQVFHVQELNSRAITAIGYHVSRREIMIGFEDGIIKTLDVDSGSVLFTRSVHNGWVTDMLYWSEAKIMFTCGNNGLLTCWNSTGNMADRILLGDSVYCLAYYARKKQLLCGMNGCIRVYDLRTDKANGHYLNIEVKYLLRNHQDIVKCMTCLDNRVYSGGLDQRLIVYEAPFGGILRAISTVNTAHSAGISCITLIQEHGNNTLIVTGSFDKCVKIWTSDCKLIHKLEGFNRSVVGLCHVTRDKALWVSGGLSHPYLFDPKSGDNVLDVLGADLNHGNANYQLEILKYISEANMIIGSTSAHGVKLWKYNALGCIATLHTANPAYCITYTKKIPILIFVGDSVGAITKWERSQTNNIVYSKDELPFSDTLKLVRKEESLFVLDSAKTKAQHYQTARDLEVKGYTEATTYYAYNKPLLKKPPSRPDNGILRCQFVEELDLIIAACEDSNIYVWGFDQSAVRALKSMKFQSLAGRKDRRKFDILLSRATDAPTEPLKKKNENDSTTNRVAGFVCKFVLKEHRNSVTALAIVRDNEDQPGCFLISGGWDRRLCVWELETGRLRNVVRKPIVELEPDQCDIDNSEVACAGEILDIAYMPTRKHIAYSSSDGMVFIRQFCVRSSEMPLLRTLFGHVAEVTCVRWNPILDMWISGSEDGSIRIWSADEAETAEVVLSTEEPITSLSVDQLNGAIIAGVSQAIHVYDPVHFKLVQTNIGHTEIIRDIMHLPERNQYISTSSDCTVRIWNAWRKTEMRP